MNMFRITSCTALLLLSCWQASTHAPVEPWQRVFTGDEFTVDVNPTSLWIEPHIFRAQFRTVFSQPETISSSSTTKYTTSLETIEFTTDQHYRHGETILLDSAGRIVETLPPNPARDWKVVKGAVTARLFDAVRALPPLGYWTVIGYRYADGKPELTASRELAELNGTSVSLGIEAIAVGKQRCSSPGYQSHALTDKEFFLKQGISLESLGVNATQAGGIILECGTREWTPPRSLILPLPSGNMLMLWKGVFIELRKRRY
jgi:hypothetical protein